MRSKQMTYGTKVLGTAETGDTGSVHALVSVFDNVDYHGDRVVKGAFAENLAEWRESGDPIPFIWSHQWGDPDSFVGTVDPEDAQETDRGLEVRAVMDLTHQQSARVYQLLKTRSVRQFSFAFDVLEEVEMKDEPFNRWWNVYELRKLKLFECGPCLLGANEETDLLEVASRHKVGRAVSGTNREKLTQAKDLIEEVLAADGDDESDPSENSRKRRGAKSAVGSHSTATSDADWDGPAQESALSEDCTAADYKKMYAWVDPDGDAETQAAYKFPHHFVSDGKPAAASTKACSAAIAALNGGRGGADIPDGDRQGVYNHVAKHLKDAGQEEIPELASVEEVQAAAFRSQMLDIEADLVSS